MSHHHQSLLTELVIDDGGDITNPPDLYQGNGEEDQDQDDEEEEDRIVPQQFWKHHEHEKPQEMALSWSRRNPGSHVVSLEHKSARDGHIGRVYYGFDSVGDFYRYYCDDVVSEDRMFHEILLPRRQCRLIVDLEYGVADNPDRPADRGPETMMALVKQMICEDLMSDFEIPSDQVHFLTLNASDPETKISYHLAVNIDGHRWKTIGQCRVFIIKLMDRAKKEYPGRLEVFNSKGKLEPFIDLGIYSPYRSIRYYMSRKHGTSRLRVLRTDEERQRGALKPDRDAFFQSLMIYPHEIHDGDDEGGGEDEDVEENDICILKVNDDDDDAGDLTGGGGVRKSSKSSNDSRSMAGSQGDLPDFALGAMRTALFGTMAMQKIVWVGDPRNLVIKYITKSKECEISGTIHGGGGGGGSSSGNHVYYQVYLKTRTYLQRCYSPDCAGKSGERRDIENQEVVDAIRKYVKRVQTTPVYLNIDFLFNNTRDLDVVDVDK